jgi:hypothetical protein
MGHSDLAKIRNSGGFRCVLPRRRVEWLFGLKAFGKTGVGISSTTPDWLLAILGIAADLIDPIWNRTSKIPYGNQP